MKTPTQEIVKLTPDHMKRVSQTKPVVALCELIWNSLDADATNIHIQFSKNVLGGYDKIIVKDNGTGITVSQIKNYLGYIGNSWKTKRNTTESGRPIHGKKGEGRFKAFSLGGLITWDSIYLDKNNIAQTKVVFNSDNSDKYEVYDGGSTNCQQTGLTVCIENLNPTISKLDLDNVYKALSQTFAFYLHCYPNINIYLDNKKIDISQEIDLHHEYEFHIDGFQKAKKLIIIEWANIKSKSILLCKQNGAVLTEYTPKPYKIRNYNYSFSAYICSEYLDELNDNNTLDLFELQSAGKLILDKAYELINEHFSNKLQQQNLERLARWKQDGIYPFEEDDNLSQIEVAEREIFDIIATKVEENLPKFTQADKKTKRFTFKLLSQAIQNNPSSLQTIITEILSLSKDEQDDFAGILQKTTLSSVIKSAKIVADRLDFLTGLENLVFNHKQSLLERDQLHKILEHEAWIFDEQFALAGSERRLEEALALHLRLLGQRQDNDDDVVLSDGRQGRLDLMLAKADEVRAGEFDYLVVELKRPRQKINDEVISQIKKYAYAVQEDNRFDKERCRWKFIAVSDEFDNYAKREASSNDRPKGCIYNGDNLQVYIMTWAEVITNAKARLKFYQDQLNYASNDSNSLAYLKEKYEQFLPKTVEEQIKSV